MTPDRFDLYERAAQSPARQAAFLRGLLPESLESPILGEDFSGGGAISRAWVQLPGGGRAVCVDLDEEPLSRARGVEGVTVHHCDVREATDEADLICALNFSTCEWHKRRDLVAYLRHARSRLRSGGLFVCDLYGGEDAFVTGESELEVRLGDSGEEALYIWEQREADPLSGRVVNAMHFRLPDGKWLRDAFVYDWRLWSVPEMRDAMADAGFAGVEIYDRLGDAIDTEGRVFALPLEGPEYLDENFVVSLVARG